MKLHVYSMFIPCLFHVFYNIFYTHLYFEDPQKAASPQHPVAWSGVPRGQKSGPTHGGALSTQSAGSAPFFGGLEHL
jgi:hypothetical protein